MLNSFPRWKYLLLAVVLVIGLIYSLPNLYGEDPAVQIIGLQGMQVDAELQQRVTKLLETKNVKVKSIAFEEGQMLIRFGTSETQLKARDLIQSNLGNQYSVALNLAPATPRWLSWFGAEPMKLGLDLRGGVRFLMDVDIASNIKRRLESIYNDLRAVFRQEKIRYASFVMPGSDAMRIEFDSKADRDTALNYLTKNNTDLVIEEDPTKHAVTLRLNAVDIEKIRNTTMDQTISTLRNRVNELGVAEAVIQREGVNKVVVELPGIQDTARAKDILGKTATLDFMLVDIDNDLPQALQGLVPPGSKLFYMSNGRPVLLKNRVILTGDSIVGATSQYNSQDSEPVVAVTLGGSGITLFKETTLNNIGKPMAVVYRESYTEDKDVDGKPQRKTITTERVISVATIQSALGNNFQISGMALEESRNLALLLRAGALPATITIVEERIIGPSMGQENIDKGIQSVVVGFCLVVFFMTIYYSVFGIIANVALLCNLILLVALMSLVGATLTLPGIAGIVLTLGMAVDASVLIFERIREEIRNGLTPHASIQRGFEHAFSTIVDSNLTTLIVGLILFAVGTGPVKGFAVTLSLGILTSLFTSTFATRGFVELMYGNRKIQKLRVGI